MRIAAVQMDIRWHDRQKNHKRARRLAEGARSEGAEIIVFPEMFSTGFSMDTAVTAEPHDGPTPTLLRALARELGAYVVGGFVLSRGEGPPQNVSLAVDPKGNDAGLYAKIHRIALLGEDERYAPGTHPVLFDIGGTGAACFICYDLRFPELFRAVVDRCGLIMVIASWPASRQAHWDVLLQARAVEEQCFVIGVNRVGEGGGHEFRGGSAIIDPLGRVLARGGEEESLVAADVDPAMVAEVREKLPFLKDRNPGLAGRSSGPNRDRR